MLAVWLVPVVVESILATTNIFLVLCLHLFLFRSRIRHVARVFPYHLKVLVDHWGDTYLRYKHLGYIAALGEAQCWINTSIGRVIIAGQRSSTMRGRA